MDRKPICASVSCFVSAFEKWTDFYVEESRQKIKRMRLRDRISYVVNPMKTSIMTNGEKRFKFFKNFLENGFVEKRHHFQIEFHKEVLKTLAPQIIGEDWDLYGPVLAKIEGWDLKNLSQILLAIAPRRAGKTRAQGQAITAHMVTVPRSEQSIFSTSQRISMYLGEMVYKFLCDAGYKSKVIKFGKERLEINGTDDPESTDTRILNYYPGNSKVYLKSDIYPFSFSFSLLLQCRSSLFFRITSMLAYRFPQCNHQIHIISLQNSWLIQSRERL